MQSFVSSYIYIFAKHHFFGSAHLYYFLLIFQVFLMIYLHLEH